MVLAGYWLGCRARAPSRGSNGPDRRPGWRPPGAVAHHLVMSTLQPVVTAAKGTPRRLVKRWFAASSLLLLVTLVTVASDAVMKRIDRG